MGPPVWNFASCLLSGANEFRGGACTIGKFVYPCRRYVVLHGVMLEKPEILFPRLLKQIFEHVLSLRLRCVCFGKPTQAHKYPLWLKCGFFMLQQELCIVFAGLTPSQRYGPSSLGVKYGGRHHLCVMTEDTRSAHSPPSRLYGFLVLSVKYSLYT